MYFVDPDGMQSDDWIRSRATGKMQYHVGSISQGTTPSDYEYIGAQAYQDNGNGTGTMYNENGTQNGVTQLSEVFVQGSTSTTATSTDGLRVYGAGGDPVAGSGAMSGDRGAGSIDAEMPGDTSMLFDVGNQIIAPALNFMLGTINAITPSTPGTNDAAQASPKPKENATVSQDTTVSIRVNEYSENSKGNDVSIRNTSTVDTTISKRQSPADVQNKVNTRNYENAKKQLNN